MSKIYNYLLEVGAVGHKNKVSISELVRKFDVPDRTIKKYVRDERQQGLAVISSSTGIS